MKKLLPAADSVVNLKAVCEACGEPAIRVQRLVDDVTARYEDPDVLVVMR